jgi:tRNA A-37 threonylcarbamoyl transferase component Bud32
VPISAEEEAELFGRLIELEDTDRIAVLSRVELDEESRGRLLELIALEAGAEDELGLSVAAAMEMWGQAGVLEPGMRVGRFEVVRELGRGGMGEVWLVEFEQEGVGRRGALKVLRRHLMAPEQLALWDRERRLVARLSHPYIAGMLDSGTLESGEPYLLMEYVEGRRLDEAVEGMAMAGRVEVMRKVCDAVAAAHRQMVVHRDLKPSNVLITTDGLPKLVDFGIGQALDLGQGFLGAGTRAYASPEQMAGEEPTMAMDVYSLGRMLERVAGEGGAELASIGRKATAAVAGDRYESVGELEEDLRRWLEKRPVEAYGDGVGYRLRCLVRRQPWATVGGAVAVALTLVALAVAWKQYERAQRRADDLRSLAGVAIFDLDREVRKLPGSMKARQMLLETATKYLADLEAAASSDLGLRAELADAYLETSTLMFSFASQSLGKQAESFALIEKAYQLREALKQYESRDPKIRRAYADTLRTYRNGLSGTKSMEEFDAVTLKLSQHGDQWLRDEPRSWEALENYQFLENAKTRYLRRSGVNAAVENQRKAVARLSELSGLGMPEPRYLRLMAEQYRLMGGILTHASLKAHSAEQLDAFTKAIRYAEEWNRVEPTVASTRTMLMIYAEFIEATVDMDVPMFGEIDRVLRRSDEVLSSPGLPDRDAEFWEENRVQVLKVRGWAAIARKDYAEMGRWFGEVRKRLDQVKDQKQWWVVMMRAQLGIMEAEIKGRK